MSILESPGLPGLERTLFTTTVTDLELLEEQGVSWAVTSTSDYSVRIDFTAEGPGVVTWPVIPASHRIEGWILPLAEGHHIPADDEEWIDNLIDRDVNTTESLSMPFIALDMEGFTVTFIFENPFDNEVAFSEDEGRLAAEVIHTFRDNWDVHEYPVTVVTGPDDPIAPARIYREWLVERGEFVSMAEKIRATPGADRLLGAPHAYLWGSRLLAAEDMRDHRDWGTLCQRLIDSEEGSAERRIFDALASAEDVEVMAVVQTLSEQEWVDRYSQRLIARALSAVFEDPPFTAEDWERFAPTEYHLYQTADMTMAAAQRHEALMNRMVIEALFGDILIDREAWGGGTSTQMIEALQEAGIERLWLGVGDWRDLEFHPQVAASAEAAGYLIAPYDSYHSMHPPDAHPDQTWPTAQFDWDAWETGGVMNVDGNYNSGFRGRGRHLSPLVAMPWVHRRLREATSIVPYNSWFVDCDAYGEFFDDHHPDHPATKRDDMEARLERLRWIRDEMGMVVGSEGGSSYAASTVHFAHGMTTPVIGWGDPDLTDRDSPHWLGGYWPPEEPRVFFDSVPLDPEYEKFHFDPRFRLPLYQAALHDSIVTTHQWGYHSLKFEDQAQTTALIELLYQVPPLFHLNLGYFGEHREHITAQAEAFHRLHSITGLLPLTDFEWLTEDRLVQRTTFGQGDVVITANFRAEPFEGVPARSIRAVGTALDAPLVHTPDPL